MDNPNRGESGYLTIMSYYAQGYSTQINGYSNPDVVYPTINKPTGVEGITNNAAVLLRNRFIIAAIGDESWKCALVCNTNRCSQRDDQDFDVREDKWGR